MIKALFRKQFAEVLAQFSRRKTTRGNVVTTRRSLITFLLIFSVLYVSLGVSFFFVFKELIAGLSSATFPFYYMTAGLLATAVGLLGSVFNAYSTIFDAKDNEMLLSLPIPPRRIVLVRVMSLSAMTLLYAGTVLLPAALVFMIYAKTTVLGYINALLNFLPLVLLVEAITLGIAFIVAAIAKHVKNKKAVVMVASFLLTILFYLIYFRSQAAMSALLVQTEVPTWARYALFFYYAMGKASQGSALQMLIALATGAGAFLLANFLLSKTFVKFTTAKKNVSVKNKKGVIKSASLRFALFKREMKLFTSSPAYVMNCAFGVLFLIVVPIVAIVKAESIRQLMVSLQEALPHANGTAIAASVILLIEGMSCITAPSVSMEGKRIYLLRSLPIPTTDIFVAKIAAHLAVVLPGTLFSSVTLAIVLRANVFCWILMILLPVVHTLFIACVGLCMNVTAPVLDWTDEMTAVKSGISVLVSVFGSMLLTIILGGAYFLVSAFMPDAVYMLIVTALYGIGVYIMMRWLATTGKRKFEKLG